MASAKQWNLPFAVKLQIINRVERGEKKSDVAAAHKILRSALSTILKNKAEIRAKGERIKKAWIDRQEQVAVVPMECTVAFSVLQVECKSVDDWGASGCHRGRTIW